MKDGLPYCVRLEDPNRQQLMDVMEWLKEKGFIKQNPAQASGVHPPSIIDRAVFDMKYQQELHRSTKNTVGHTIVLETKPVYYYFFNDPNVAMMFKLTWM